MVIPPHRDYLNKFTAPCLASSEERSWRDNDEKLIRACEAPTAEQDHRSGWSMSWQWPEGSSSAFRCNGSVQTLRVAWCLCSGTSRGDPQSYCFNFKGTWRDLGIILTELQPGSPACSVRSFSINISHSGPFYCCVSPLLISGSEDLLVRSVIKAPLKPFNKRTQAQPRVRPPGSPKRRGLPWNTRESLVALWQPYLTKPGSWGGAATHERLLKKSQFMSLKGFSLCQNDEVLLCSHELPFCSYLKCGLYCFGFFVYIVQACCACLKLSAALWR